MLALKIDSHTHVDLIDQRTGRKIGAIKAEPFGRHVKLFFHGCDKISFARVSGLPIDAPTPTDKRTPKGKRAPKGDQ